LNSLISVIRCLIEKKYDEDIGRFTSIDPLWEKYYSWTPYHYWMFSKL